MKEKWKIVSIDSRYKVSNFGKVLNIKFNRLLKGTFDKGYRFVYFSKNCRVAVHILVARAFIGPCPKGKEVNHKDLVKSNNHYKNLEYLTSLENIAHAVKHYGNRWGNYKAKNMSRSFGERNGNSKLTKVDVKKILKSNLNQKNIAKLLNISQSTISNIRSGKTWKINNTITV